MGVKFSNNAATVLAASISDVATTITVVDASEFPAVGGADYAYLTLANGTAIEVVKVTAITGTDLTVIRGQEGTVASAFNLGDACELRITAGMLTDALAEQPALNDVSDVTITTPVSGQALTYNGTGWVNGSVGGVQIDAHGLTRNGTGLEWSGGEAVFNSTTVDEWAALPTASVFSLNANGHLEVTF